MRKSLFYKIYFAAIAVCAVLLVILLIWLNGWLRNFEAAQPAYIVDNAVTQYLDKNDVNGLLERYNTVLSPYEPLVDMNALFTEKRQDREIAATSLGKTEAGLQYAVKAGEDTLLRLELKKEDKTSVFGERYTLAGVIPDESMLRSVKLLMPSDATVKINGVELQAKDRVNVENIPSVEAFCGNSTAAYFQTATVSGLSKTPEITAFQGETPLAVELENGVYTVKQAVSADEQKAVLDFALEAAHAYAAYMQNDSYFGRISKYLKADTDFYTNVRTCEVTFVWKHDSYHFEQDSTTAFHKYNDNLYRCRVSFVHVLKLGNQVYKDYFDQYVYVCKDANGMQVLDMQQSAAS